MEGIAGNQDVWALEAVTRANEFALQHGKAVLLNSGLELRCTTHFSGLLAPEMLQNFIWYTVLNRSW